MTIFTFVGDIVETNGKTVKENNLNKNHNIPLKSLVEIVNMEENEEGSENGLRLFVVGHSRDCDGTPLYDLSFTLSAIGEIERINKEFGSELAVTGEISAHERMLFQCNLWTARGRISSGYPEYTLKVIR